MSSNKSANVMFARKCLRNLSRDLLSTQAKNLCNELDYLLRCDDKVAFSGSCSDIRKWVTQDLPPDIMREIVQVISLIRFPIWELDKKETFTQQRSRVNGLSTTGCSTSDLRILRDAGTCITSLLRATMHSDPLAHVKHGPGVTAETNDPLKKREVVFLPKPLVGFAKNIPSFSPELVPPVSRTLLVPKDHKSLRTIACEPTWTQWTQQGYMGVLMRVIEDFPLFRGRITFRSQVTQHALIRKNQDAATIDLSDASDAIRWKHVLMMIKDLEVREWIAKLRTPVTSFQGVLYPTIGVFPMGAALCFPFETLVFASLVCAYSLAETGRLPRYWGVFGDDIIIPDTLYGGFCSFLQRIGFKPNLSKSFCGTFFVETCGLYLYKGIDITPIKIKKIPPTSPQCENNLTYKDYSRRASHLCYTHLCTFFDSHIMYPFGVTRWNRDYQRWETRVLSFKMARRNTRFTYPEALLHGSGQVSYGGITPSHDWLPLEGRA